MRGAHDFGCTLAYGGLAGVCWLAGAALLGPLVGTHTVVRLAIVASAVVYAVALAPTRRRAAVAALAGAGLGAGLLIVPFGIACTAVGAAGILALLRSAFLHRARAWRAIATEVALQSAGLALAAFLANGTAVGLALALWGYFLVQSVFFLIGGVAPRTDPPPSDPFERARGELLALLD